MAFFTLNVGKPATQSSGSQPYARGGQQSEIVISELMPRYYELARNSQLFWSASQAATAISVALATTYTGLCISNPAGNTKNIIPIKVGLALSVAPVAIAPIGLITGYLSTGVVTHTTPLTPASNVIGTGPAPTAKADAAATLVGTPAWTEMLVGGFTASALPASSPALIDLEGSLIIPPGGYVAIGALTAVTGLWSMAWAELDIAT